MISSFVSLILVLISCIDVKSEVDGWKMTDRFNGFRFEIIDDDDTPHSLVDMKEEIQGKGFKLPLKINKTFDANVSFHLRSNTAAKADEYFCFGWVQDSSIRNSIVGEARCTKKNGYKMKLWLSSFTNESIIKDYEDTKIKLHFSHFKILHRDRITCFRDEPHKCEDLSIPLW